MLILSSVELPPPTVVVIASSSGSIVGQDLNLTCTVTTVDGLVLPPLVEVLDPSGNTLMTGGNVLLGSPVTEGVVTTLEVGLLSLGIADGGRYMCRATISAPGVGDVLSESGIDITLQREFVVWFGGYIALHTKTKMSYCLCVCVV